MLPGLCDSQPAQPTVPLPPRPSLPQGWAVTHSPPSPAPQHQRATHLAKKVPAVDAGGGVAFQLHLGRGRLQRLCLRDAGDFVIGAFNPVAPKLGQQDEGEGPFSPQDLKEDSAESHPHCTPLGAPRHPPIQTWSHFCHG